MNNKLKSNYKLSYLFEGANSGLHVSDAQKYNLLQIKQIKYFFLSTIILKNNNIHKVTKSTNTLLSV